MDKTKVKVKAIQIEPCVYKVDLRRSRLPEPEDGDSYSDRELEEEARAYCENLPLTAVFREARGIQVIFDCPIMGPKEVQDRIEAERERSVQERIERERREEAERERALELNGMDYALRWAEGRVEAPSPPPGIRAVVERAKTVLEKQGWTRLRIVANLLATGTYVLVRDDDDRG